MKNPTKHINIRTILHLIRSITIHFSNKVNKISISKDYLYLCLYADYRTIFEFGRNAKINFDQQAFLVLGTERSSFREWTNKNKIYIENNGKLNIHGYNQIGRGSLVWILEDGQIEFKGNSYTAGNNIIIAKEKVTIGEDCSIAFGVTITDHDFHKTYTQGIQNIETAPVCIGRGVWIGMNSTILKGVSIGDGSIVAAHSVVTKSVPSRCMVAGNPAKIIKTEVEFYG